MDTELEHRGGLGTWNATLGPTATDQVEKDAGANRMGCGISPS